ncbi:hypothetical protein [Citromicrobium bathyomarinum]|uniref:hypothetical protein n=1 Tax=Citromicrobium bathyomarinum TaxID=72174 RepID=UPI001E52AB37|nr:hypothetical protein [Citromicrobium bathyomarinum]MCD1621454.1 hypothetical protein [Citromicrobium bathyomarinum]
MGLDLIGIAALSSVTTVAAFIAIAKIFGKSLLENAVRHQFDLALEDYRNEQEIKAKAEKIAEYLAIACDLNDKSSEEDYRAATRLAFELYIYLPADIYRSLVSSHRPGGNFSDALIKARTYLLDENEPSLTADDLMRHASPEVIAELRRGPASPSKN